MNISREKLNDMPEYKVRRLLYDGEISDEMFRKYQMMHTRIGDYTMVNGRAVPNGSPMGERARRFRF